jgi:hypothetical protein
VTKEFEDLRRRITALELELARTKRELETRHRTNRAWITRAALVSVSIVLVGAMSLALAAQTPAVSTDTLLKAPVNIVDKKGVTILRVDGGDAGVVRGVQIRDEGNDTRITLHPLVGGIIGISGKEGRGMTLRGGGQSGIRLHHGGVTEAALESDGDGSYLWVADPAGNEVFHVAHKVALGEALVTIGAGNSGTTSVRVFNEKKTLLAAMGQTPGGAGAIAAYDTSGVMRSLVSGKDGEIASVDTAGNLVAMMHSRNNRPEIVVQSPKAALGKLAIERGGGGILEIANAAGDRQAVVAVTAESEGKACVMTSKRGEVCLGTPTLPATLPGVAR